MFKRCLMVSLLSLTLAQTVLWSCHAAPREIAAPAAIGVSLPDVFDAAHGQWKYYKVSRPPRDRCDRDAGLDPAA